MKALLGRFRRDRADPEEHQEVHAAQVRAVAKTASALASELEALVEDLHSYIDEETRSDC